MGFKSADRFYRIGLRTNPFNQRDHSEVLAIFGADPWVRSLYRQDWRVAVLHGPSGCGKTTGAHMMTALAKQDGLNVGYYRLGPGSVSWPGVARHDLTVIDSIQRIPVEQRARYRDLVVPGGRLLLVGQEDVTHGDPDVLRMTPPPPDADELRRHVEVYTALARLRPQLDWRLNTRVLNRMLDGAGWNRFGVLRALYHGFELLADRPDEHSFDEAWVDAALRLLEQEQEDVELEER